MPDTREGSPAIEVLEMLRLHDAVASLEERVATVELDIGRLSAARDDDTRRITSEMAVMRARVDDAVSAVRETELTIRSTATPSVASPADDGLVRGVVAGVGDAMTSLQQVTDARFDEVRVAVEQIATAVGSLVERVEELEARL